MHEAAITEALIEQVRAAMPEGSALLRCRIEVGQLEHLDPEVMQTMWRASVDGSPLAGASLLIESVPLRVRCGACGSGFEPADRAILLCPACGRVRPEVLAGTGVVLRSLEVQGGG